MAMQLIDSLSAEWKPEKYTDEYRDNLMKVIQGKLKGRRPRLQERETAQSADVVDLMARLRASLEGTARPENEDPTCRPEDGQARRAKAEARCLMAGRSRDPARRQAQGSRACRGTHTGSRHDLVTFDDIYL